MLNEAAGFVGGLGMFFVGLKMTGDGVRSLAGRKFRNLFLKWTRTVPSGAFMGFASGVIFQSTSGLTLILANMVGVGATSVANAIPVILGANAGAATLSLMAVIDFKVMMLLMIGLSGLVVAFEKPYRFTKAAEIAFGVGLLLFGLYSVRLGVEPLAETGWFQAMLASSGLPLPVYFGIGFLACMLVQSADVVSVLAITLGGSEIIDSTHAMMFIYGSILGSAFMMRMYAIQLTGARKRMAMAQVCYNLVGLSIFLPVFTMEHLTGLPLLLPLPGHIFADKSAQLLCLSLSFECVTTIVLLMLAGPYNRLLERFFPDDPGSQDYLGDIHELNGLSPDIACLAVNKAQSKIVSRLTGYMDVIRRHFESCQPSSIRELDAALDVQLRQIDDCLQEIAETVLDHQTAGNLTLLQNVQAMIRAACAGLVGVAGQLAQLRGATHLETLGSSMLESLDLLLISLAETFDSPDPERWSELLLLCQDRGPAMERIRTRYLNESESLPREERGLLLRLTAAYERQVWIIRHLALPQRQYLGVRGLDASALEDDESRQAVA